MNISPASRSVLLDVKNEISRFSPTPNEDSLMEINLKVLHAETICLDELGHKVEFESVPQNLVT